MDSIEVYRGRSQLSRRSARELSSIYESADLAIERVHAKADVQSAQIDAMTAVTQRGLQGAAYITSVEMALAEATPAAMVRLKMIGDTGTMALGQIVMDTASKLRRI